MRTRIITLIVLFFFLSIPLVGYWYFMIQKESSLTVTPSQDVDFRVELHGSFKYSLLPLADTFLDFKQECHKTCIFSPLPPAEYDVTFSSTGNIATTKKIVLSSGEKQSLEYDILSDISLTPMNEDIEREIPIISSQYSFLSYIGESMLVFEKTGSGSSLGFLTAKGYRPIKQIPREVKDASLDLSKRYVLLEGGFSTMIISVNFDSDTEFPLSLGTPLIVSSSLEGWRIRTTQGIYEYIGNNWEQNIRFTDFIDLSPSYRIGYIAASDTDRLALGNFTIEQGVFVLLNRTTGESYVVRENIDIDGFYSIGETPVYQDTFGKRYSLKISN